MNDNRFSFRKRALSFTYAWKGIKYLLGNQHNFILHFLALVAVIAAGLVFHLSKLEWIAISIVCGMVITAELFNTAIEVLCNEISPGYNKQIGIVKDVAAAAVLVSAITAVVVGFIVFGGRITIF